MKNIKIALILVFSTLFLASCNYTRLGWHNRTDDSIYGEFDYFNGSYSESIEVAEGETISVVVELNVEEGEMYVFVEDENDNILFETESTDVFEYTADSDTKITATVNAEKAGGSYKVTFQK